MKPLEPSSLAAAALGPKALTPSWVRRSTRLGADDDEVDGLFLGQRDNTLDILRAHGQASGLLGNAGIAGRCIDLLAQRRGGDRPDQRVLAPAAADHENFHGSPPLDGLSTKLT
jgi:hypothetical protein